MRKIEYLDKYIKNPEVIKVGVYKGVKYIIAMKESPIIFIQKPNISDKGCSELYFMLAGKIIGRDRLIDKIDTLPGFVPSQLEEPITNLYNGWFEIWFDGIKDYETGGNGGIFGAIKKEKRSLEYVLEITCDCIDLIKKFHRVYRDYDLDKAYQEIEEWEKQIKEAYDEIKQD